jgi:hypothetical protein
VNADETQQLDGLTLDVEAGLDRIPLEDAPWHPTIVEFALAFDGYDALGGERLLAYAERAFERWRTDGSLPDDLRHLRSCLYWEQRVQWHVEDSAGPSEPPPERFAYARALIGAIRAIARQNTLDVRELTTAEVEGSMGDFQARLVAVGGDGDAVDLFDPVPFDGRVSETQLEEWIVKRPELVGEDLLVVGRQLHEFAEDADRLDVLAIDRDGELVLIELKATSGFRTTDLQALAYAGAYATRTASQIARTLHNTLRGTNANAGLEDAASQITAFLDLDSFDEWQPSQHVRIKLIAPGFPRRVLRTVKWLGDVYGVRIEAILVRLFEITTDGLERPRYQLTLERLLPLAGDEEFDLTVRDREKRQRKENLARRRPDVVPALLESGHLKQGQTLWVPESALPVYARQKYDPENPVFQVRIDTTEGQPKFRWQATVDSEPELVSPSATISHILAHLFPDRSQGRKHRGVARRFAVSPGGKTLKEIALENELWLDEVEERDETTDDGQ